MKTAFQIVISAMILALVVGLVYLPLSGCSAGIQLHDLSTGCFGQVPSSLPLGSCLLSESSEANPTLKTCIANQPAS